MKQTGHSDILFKSDIRKVKLRMTDESFPNNNCKDDIVFQTVLLNN